MADTTYQTDAVYHKQGGNELVVSNSGQITTESGGEIEIESGGSISVESGGEIEILSGGKLDLQSGAEFQFYSTDFPASYLENLILSLTTYTVMVSTYSDGDTSVLSVAYGTFLMDFSTGYSVGSAHFKLPAPQSGRILRFFGSQMGADALIAISDNSKAVAGAGLTTYITNALSVALSSISMALGTQLELRYVAADTWAVVSGNASVTENAAA
jgi:hypothetical protein